MTAVVSSLMGEKAVLYKDPINFKLLGGGAHAAHQDGVACESGVWSNSIRRSRRTSPS